MSSKPSSAFEVEPSVSFRWPDDTSLTLSSDLRCLLDEFERVEPGEAVFGSAPGNGSLSHFLGISVGLATKVPMTHVAYKDSGVGLIDLSAGRLLPELPWVEVDEPARGEVLHLVAREHRVPSHRAVALERVERAHAEQLQIVERLEIGAMDDGDATTADPECETAASLLRPVSCFHFQRWHTSRSQTSRMSR